ncbi:HAUS augmin-like complex subunit 2 [Nerophis lumbriciformis]|uniref:HAUS augmin-like complex subunit 2 n=1 Tax=Nerophis lumbriciformis TaxID=546530 RepID=UPI002AE01377|nr:HAUS augmin-like complex subunit 2 [Nerophis lumbriciformis]
MPQEGVSPFTVTSAASLVSKCVSSGAVTQEELNSAYSQPNSAFSSQLRDAEQRIRMQKELDQLQLEAELLRVEKLSADVTHPACLATRFQTLQMFCTHLQDVLKDQNRLRHRLMRPPARTSLPVRAHLHRSVVNVVHALLDFVERLDEKTSAVARRPAVAGDLARLNSSLAQLLALVAEAETLANQLLQWKDIHSSLMSDSLTPPPSSHVTRKPDLSPGFI